MVARYCASRTAGCRFSAQIFCTEILKISVLPCVVDAYTFICMCMYDAYTLTCMCMYDAYTLTCMCMYDAYTHTCMCMCICSQIIDTQYTNTHVYAHSYKLTCVHSTRQRVRAVHTPMYTNLHVSTCGPQPPCAPRIPP